MSDEKSIPRDARGVVLCQGDTVATSVTSNKCGILRYGQITDFKKEETRVNYGGKNRVTERVQMKIEGGNCGRALWRYGKDVVVVFPSVEEKGIQNA